MPPVSNTVWIIVGILAIAALVIFIIANVNVQG
jgi:uncharacterized membrane protein